MNEVNLILSVPAIVAVVTLGKAFGIVGKWALLAAIVVAVAFNVADYLWGSTGAYAAVVQGLLLGLAAAGLYDVAKTAAPTIGK